MPRTENVDLLSVFQSSAEDTGKGEKNILIRVLLGLVYFCVSIGLVRRDRLHIQRH